MMLTNKEAIEILQMYKDEIGQRIDKANALEVKDVYQWQMNGFDMAIDALQQTAWIPVWERLPDIDEPVIVCWDDGKITDGYRWCEESWFCAWGEYNGWHRKGRDKRIIAWMPLPEPYKGGDINDD